MTGIRVLRWIILLAALIASITWSYVAIDHLLDYSISQQERASQYTSTSQPASARLKVEELQQKRWSKQSLFSVACSFLFLLATMMNWVLDGRPQRGREIK